MSRFNTLLENQLNNTNLLRIRVKHDPANNNGERRDYVGYVLEEDGLGNILAIVPGLSPDAQRLGPEQYIADMEPSCGDQIDPLTKFKKHLVNHLMVRGYHDKISEHMESILNTNCVKELESIMRGCGCDTSSILDLYRDYVTDE